MVKQVDKVSEIRHPEVVREVMSNASRVFPENLELNLFDIDPYVDPERPIHFELDLDQLEDAEE